MSERERIAFIEARDGIPAAIAWVERTLKLYRQCLRVGHGRHKQYRAMFVRSCLEFRGYLRGL
jgi:hypothetical protein